MGGCASTDQSPLSSPTALSSPGSPSPRGDQPRERKRGQDQSTDQELPNTRGPRPHSRSPHQPTTSNKYRENGSKASELEEEVEEKGGRQQSKEGFKGRSVMDKLGRSVKAIMSSRSVNGAKASLPSHLRNMSTIIDSSTGNRLYVSLDC